MAGHPLFRRVHEFTSGTFDKDFQDYVSKLVDNALKEQARPPK
jgi:hypothetical protein